MASMMAMSSKLFAISMPLERAAGERCVDSVFMHVCNIFCMCRVWLPVFGWLFVFPWYITYHVLSHLLIRCESSDVWISYSDGFSRPSATWRNIFSFSPTSGDLSLLHLQRDLSCSVRLLLTLILRCSHSAVFSLPEAKILSYFGLVPSGHILDIPNGILGMIYYTYILMRYISIAMSPMLFRPLLNFVISALAMASSLFLGRKLLILKEICVVCLTTHAINTTLFYRSIREISRAGKVKSTWKEEHSITRFGGGAHLDIIYY